MKKFTIVICLSCILNAFAPAAHAADPVTGKLTRGVVMIATAPLEIPKQTRIYWKEGEKKTPHVAVWIFCGAVKGVVNMVARIGSGVWDVATFPIPIPKGYKPLLDLQKLY